MKKLTPKEKAVLTRVLKALKSRNYIQSYQIEGDELNSVRTQWMEGAAERASAEILQKLGRLGPQSPNGDGWESCFRRNAGTV